MGAVIQNKIKRSKNLTKGAIRIEKANAFLLAYTLGKISPKIKINAVIIPTSINKSTTGLSISSKRVLLSSENKSTIAILIKLFATKMVAKRRLGFRRREITRWIAGLGSSFSESSKDFSCKEKKATSAPEIRAEHSNKKRTKTDWIQITSGVTTRAVNTGNGSGSNRFFFKRVNRQHFQEVFPPHLVWKEHQTEVLLARPLFWW